MTGCFRDIRKEDRQKEDCQKEGFRVFRRPKFKNFIGAQPRMAVLTFCSLILTPRKKVVAAEELMMEILLGPSVGSQ